MLISDWSSDVCSADLRDEIGSRALVDHQPVMADRSTPPALRRSEMRDGVKFIIMFTGKKFPAYRIVDAVGLCRRAVGRYLGETIETAVAPVVRERGVADLDARFARLEGLVPLEIGLIVPIRGDRKSVV